MSQAETSLQDLRNQYRAAGERTHLNPAWFRRRCRAKISSPSFHRYICAPTKDSDITPELWVKAAKAVADEEEWERECEEAGIDTEGFMGTGMSEDQYFRALGFVEPY